MCSMIQFIYKVHECGHMHRTHTWAHAWAHTQGSGRFLPDSSSHASLCLVLVLYWVSSFSNVSCILLRTHALSPGPLLKAWLTPNRNPMLVQESGRGYPKLQTWLFPRLRWKGIFPFLYYTFLYCLNFQQWSFFIILWSRKKTTVNIKNETEK